MPDTGSAELAVLLSQLSRQAGESEHDPADVAGRPSADEAMALYYVTARVVELQLQLARRGDGAELQREMATTRELLEQTRRVLAAALGEKAPAAGAPEQSRESTGKPYLSVVHGEKSRRRSRRT